MDSHDVEGSREAQVGEEMEGRKEGYRRPRVSEATRTEHKEQLKFFVIRIGLGSQPSDVTWMIGKDRFYLKRLKIHE